jgi:hypothetical protein
MFMFIKKRMRISPSVKKVTRWEWILVFNNGKNTTKVHIQEHRMRNNPSAQKQHDGSNPRV